MSKTSQRERAQRDTKPVPQAKFKKAINKLSQRGADGTTRKG